MNQDVFEAIKTRRSIRRYKEKIPDEKPIPKKIKSLTDVVIKVI